MQLGDGYLGWWIAKQQQACLCTSTCASATLCRWPPDSLAGHSPPWSPSPTWASVLFCLNSRCATESGTAAERNCPDGLPAISRIDGGMDIYGFSLTRL